MDLLAKIYRDPNLNLQGRAILRSAVRCVALQERQILMVHDRRYDDFKFPGGGAEQGETHEHTLRRELQEETGARLLGVLGPLGMVIEYACPKEADFDLFQMTSYYYRCRVDPLLGPQQLDDYEREFGFRPVWLEVAEAVRHNQALLASRAALPRWVRRETFVLETILKTM